MEPTPQTPITPDTLEAIGEQARQSAAQAREASTRIQQVRAEGRSDRGTVTAVVDGSALLVDVEFTPAASATPATLGALVKQAHDRAVEEWQRQVDAITEEVLADQPTLRTTIQRTSAAGVAAHTGPQEPDPSQAAQRAVDDPHRPT